ncbi:hypothetical protein HN011_009616, partial [Eciton burchellii]
MNRGVLDTDLRDDISSLAEAVKNLTHDMRIIKENRVTVKRDDHQAPSEIHPDHSSIQVETGIRPNTPSLEDATPVSRLGRQPTLREILTPVPRFDIPLGFNIPLSQFIRECREVECAVMPHEEANVLILLRGKLTGRSRQALQGRQFATIKQFIERLQTS